MSDSLTLKNNYKSDYKIVWLATNGIKLTASYRRKASAAGLIPRKRYRLN